MSLNADIYGEEGEPLLLVHGLFGSARNFGVLARRLSDRWQVTVPDQRNHGLSPWHDSHSYFDMAQDLAPLAGGDVVGHSMGGKAAMVLALTRPERVRRLIVADIAPVAYGHTQAHLVEAMAALDPDQPTRSAAREALQVDESVRDFLLQSLDLREKRWRLNLDVLGREMDRILGFPDIDATYDGPTLFLSGAESDYVLPEHRDRIKALFPQAKFAKLPGAGHWLHAEKPREFEATIRAFFA
ncbi:Esterase/lipase/thioesterase [Oceanicola granulosus HTCC2516]|uniref:Esterase/lipase/thioesterase n=1 Tax=Oceanicola granulosus (strain ATCC BAA-861 / DSM 15982 / KCTC 12143 / HTCC2516) TaxID=314256 RepID=Q2CGY5_OCEGH|nr:alpha/beta fold hydrolase [Oceanicola granulosus]EAR52026.1 Esterase/lipase/thioesterase [Oceanicola granulosus HTCC2516]